VQSTVYGGNALKADVFRPKDVVDMLLDEEEEQDLKERQQKFLRTRRVKRKNATVENGGHDYNGNYNDTEMIDTTAAVSNKKNKENASPAKPLKKPSPGPRFDIIRPSNGIPSSKPSSGVKNIFSTFKPGAVVVNQINEEEGDEDEEDEEINDE